MRKTQERLKILQDSRIVISNPISEVGDFVLIHNEMKQNKLDSEWIGPGTVMRRSSETNFQILFVNKYYIIHANRLKPYYQYYNNMLSECGLCGSSFHSSPSFSVSK